MLRIKQFIKPKLFYNKTNHFFKKKWKQIIYVNVYCV